MKNLGLVALLCVTVAARAQSTAFLYQGRLTAKGAPYSGLADMQFTLFNTATGGVAIAPSTPVIAGINVSSGSFTVPVDFGAGAFTGADRWLEIQVRTNQAAFTTLRPRQALS